MASSASPSSLSRSYSKYSMKKTLLKTADLASCCCALALIALILFAGFTRDGNYGSSAVAGDQYSKFVKGKHLSYRPCDEIYVVGEGETLHTISDKCGDPYIIERNPHIHDPDDVFPGLVIKIISSRSTN